MERETGIGDPRGRPFVPRDQAEASLSKLAGREVKLPEQAVVSKGPTSCPACGSSAVAWAVTFEGLDRENADPLIWHETEWLADSFVCPDCNAGWIEPDDPEPINWVRPYRVGM
ncbi:MAG TPA: hypothetical protein VGO03_19965 [Acidimicrobiia bacterium]|jgi:hypothetical protein